MPRSARAVVIGAGHNGLTAAFYLARSGLRPVVFDAASVVGGGAVTSEIVPGFRCPTLSHDAHLSRRIVADMNLAALGVEWVQEPIDACGLSATGPAVVLAHDEARTAAALRSHSEHDAAQWPAFLRAKQSATTALSALLEAAPPNVATPSAGDLWRLLGAYREMRSRPEADRYELLRWLPMPIADVMEEQFESELVRATLAAQGLPGTAHGPRAAGSMLAWLTRETLRRASHPVPSIVRGGPGRLTQAMARAATLAGAEIRLGARVERVLTSSGAVVGIVADAREVPADLVISCVDPKTTFLSLVEPGALPDDFAQQMNHYRSAGAMAKLNVALAELPRVPGVTAPRDLSGRVHVGPTLDYLEAASDATKYGRWSPAPWLDCRMPSILDDTLAPTGAHVASINIHCTPRHLRDSSWTRERQALQTAVLDLLDGYMPGFSAAVVGTQLLTPEDLEDRHHYWGGQGFHGEVALDQWYVMRPSYGHAAYRSPIRGLYLGGGGAHPGGFVSGSSGRLAAESALRG